MIQLEGWSSRPLPSPRSGRERKAWGVSPRIALRKICESAERTTAEPAAFSNPIYRHAVELRLSPAGAGLVIVCGIGPGAHAPGFMLARLFRRLLKSGDESPHSKKSGAIWLRLLFKQKCRLLNLRRWPALWRRVQARPGSRSPRPAWIQRGGRYRMCSSPLDSWPLSDR